jgi:hypothetical protein
MSRRAGASPQLVSQVGRGSAPLASAEPPPRPLRGRLAHRFNCNDALVLAPKPHMVRVRRLLRVCRAPSAVSEAAKKSGIPTKLGSQAFESRHLSVPPTKLGSQGLQGGDLSVLATKLGSQTVETAERSEIPTKSAPQSVAIRFPVRDVTAEPLAINRLRPSFALHRSRTARRRSRCASSNASCRQCTHTPTPTYSNTSWGEAPAQRDM